jgi:hypothetical protein
MPCKSTKWIVAALLLTTAGCGGDYDGLVPVTGKVTFDGGPPPAAGFLSFIPAERTPGKTTRPGRATFQTDGVYEAMSFKEGDGLFPGSYIVTVMCNKGDIDYSKKDPFNAASYVALGYEGEKLVVEDGSDEITLDIDAPLKK